MDNKKLLENVMELALSFASYMEKDEFIEPNSTVSLIDQFKDNALDWAIEFEEIFNGEDEYLVEIASFAERKFREMGWLSMHEKTAAIVISEKEAEKIDELLSVEPSSREESLGEDGTMTWTVNFGDQIQADVKICGVKYQEGEANLPWTEAVLFDHGNEVCCSEPCDAFFGIWDLEYNDTVYRVKVGREGIHEETTKNQPEEPSAPAFVILTAVCEGRYGTDLMSSLHATAEEAEEEAIRLMKTYGIDPDDEEFRPESGVFHFSWETKTVSMEEVDSLLAKRKVSTPPEPLTAGLLKGLSAGRNIPELESFLQERSDDEELSLMNRGDYFATKVWQKDDIEACLEDNDYPVTEENIQRVLKCKMLNTLNDCTEIDWGIIEAAIEYSACAYSSFMLLRELKERWLRLESVHGSTGADFMIETYLKGNPIPAVPEDTAVFDERDMETFLNDFNHHLARLMDPKVYGNWSEDIYKYTRKFHGEKCFNEIENPTFIDAILSEVLKMIPAIKEDGPFAIALYDLHDKIVYFESEEAAKDFMNLYAVEYAVAYHKEADKLVEVGEIYIEEE